MTCFQPGTTLDLASRDNLPMHDARGTILRVNRGSLWITQENDTQDIVLRTGDTWVIERNGLTIVEAQTDTSVCVAGPNAAAAIVARGATRRDAAARWPRLRLLVAALMAAAASRRSVPLY